MNGTVSKISKKDILLFFNSNLTEINNKRIKKKLKKFTKTSLKKKNKESLIYELSRQNKPIIKKYFKSLNIKGKDKLNKNVLKKDIIKLLKKPTTITTKKKSNILKENLLKLKNEDISTYKIKFNQTQSRANVLKNIMNTLPESKVILNLGQNNFFTLNKNNMGSLMNRLNNLEYSEYDKDSKTKAINQIFKVNNISISVLKPPPNIPLMDFLPDEPINNIVNNLNNFNTSKKISTKKNGKFFKYTHNLDLDLTRYGIYKTGSDFKNRDYKNNCLIRALTFLFEELGETTINYKIILQDIMLKCKNRSVPMSSIKKICEMNDITIKIKHFYELTNTRIIKYGTKGEIFNLCLYDDHYFINDKVNITYNNLINDCYIGTNSTKQDRRTTSYKVVKYLVDNKDKYLERIPISNEMFKTVFHNKFNDDNFITLDYNIKNNTKIFKYELKEKKSTESLKVFFDFESCPIKKHIPFLVRCKYNNIEKGFVGFNCGKKFLEHLTTLDYKNITLIAHNITYDYRFISKYVFNDDLIEKGKNLMCGSCMFKNYINNKIIKIQLKDSYKLITMPLSKFGKCFKLKQGKDMMPYDIYTEENVSKRFVKKSEVMKSIHLELKTHKTDLRHNEQIKKNIKLFNENIIKWNCSKNNYVDIIKYSNKYCKIDVEVLEQGYETFRKWFLDEPFGLDIDNIVSISSLSQKFFEKTLCYEGVAMLSGVPRSFIQKCLVGGRCCLNKNKRQKVKGKIADFDARSLYPTALYRLGGLLKGKPKVLKNLNYDFLKNQDGYFIKIQVIENGADLDFSLMSYIDDKSGVRNFTNDMKNKFMYVDKTTLEDLITYQEIKFKIIKGYYYDEDRNYTCKEVIKMLYDTRKKFKNEIQKDGTKGNPIQVCYKLLMNSIYGKTIQKPIEKDACIKRDWAETKNYIFFNYNSVVDFYKLGESKKWKISTLKPINDHFTFNSVGIEILSMSKRIMNEVFDIAQKNKLKIYIQDTDSLHIDLKNVPVLEKLFKQKYNRKLIGSDMGEFHSDFEMSGCINVYSEYLIAIGKKCYIDCLVGENEETGEIEKDYHIRMKGCPNKSLLHTADKIFNGSLIEMYEYLHDDNSIINEKGEIIHGLDFNLLCPDNNKKSMRAQFKFNNDYTIETETEFIRHLRFKTP
tara:strand:- start:5431 stop:8880 length:3450 start_codon:yes stop_codon:yes gene_type:complete